MSASSSGFKQLDLEARFELLDRRARRRHEPELWVGRDVGGFFLVVLVLDIADDLLDQILDRHKSVRAAVLVDHERHVDARRLHANEQVHRRHGRRHVEHRSPNLGHRDRTREIEAAQIRFAEVRRLFGYIPRILVRLAAASRRPRGSTSGRPATSAEIHRNRSLIWIMPRGSSSVSW